MSTLIRIEEIQRDVSAIVSLAIGNTVGTDNERPFMTQCMDASLMVVKKLRDLAVEGITFEKWRDYFVNHSVHNDFLVMVDNEAGDLVRFATEIREMDLTEYYRTMVEGQVDVKLLNDDVDRMEDQRKMLLEIWAEEDEEATVEEMA